MKVNARNLALLIIAIIAWVLLADRLFDSEWPTFVGTFIIGAAMPSIRSKR